MSNSYIRSSRPFFPKEDIDKITADLALVLENGQLRNGQNLRNFEKAAASYLGIEHCVALDSDLSALETTLRFFNVKNKEVIVCTNSFISIPNSILYSGGKAVFCDIKKDTLSMDPESLLKNLSPKTAGVIVTHIAGFPNPDFQEIQEICQKNGLFLIEDATHALGARIGNQIVGTFGNASIFAFTPTKLITTSEGGMLATNDDELAEYARLYRYYGSGAGKTNFESLGRHMMMPEISAILGIYQLNRIETFIDKRNKLAEEYNEAFDQIPDVYTVKCLKQNRCSYYKYPLTLSSKVDKEKFVKALTSKGVETGTVFYPPCHMQPFYRKLNSGKSQLWVAEEVLARTITLPMHCELSDFDVSTVITNVQLAVGT
ncbi:MAG: DegT/DnrJ/EryC1/StrS family aminotransferase [Candidatus Bathyarchaeia archaeon]